MYGFIGPPCNVIYAKPAPVAVDAVGLGLYGKRSSKMDVRVGDIYRTTLYGVQTGGAGSSFLRLSHHPVVELILCRPLLPDRVKPSFVIFDIRAL